MQHDGSIGRLGDTPEDGAARTSSADPATPRADGVGPEGAAGSVGGLHDWRRPTGIAVGAAGVALYNWWVVVAVHSHLLTTPDELFSDLEAVGRPDAALLQRLDLVAGLVLIAALLARGRRGPDGARAEWPWLVAFAAAGAVGGRFAYACPEGLSASCRSAEWRLALPAHHYVHVASGIAEFATATVAIYLARRRTRPVERPTTQAIRWTGRTLVVAYPLLGYAYLTDRMGALVEPIFFLCFSIMVLVELVEPDRGGTVPDTQPSRGPDRLTAGSRRPLDCLPVQSAHSVQSAAGCASGRGRTGTGREAPD